MSVSFLAAGGATAVAAVITGILVGRFANLPRMDQAAWSGLGRRASRHTSIPVTTAATTVAAPAARKETDIAAYGA